VNNKAKSLNVIFAGTPEFAATILDSIQASNHQVVACYTQPDRPAGRGRKLQTSAVKQRALADDIPVYQPNDFKQACDIERLESLNADLMVVVAYGLILPKAVLEIPRMGCLNVHASLLPRWRGAAPIQRAIIDGDRETGITIMQMDEGLDTGNILGKISCPIAPDDTGGSLHDKLAQLGATAALNTLNQLADAPAFGDKQDDSHANYAHKLSKQEGRVDWAKSSQSIKNLIRAFNPWPVAHTEIDNHNVRIWESVETTREAIATPGTILKADKEGITVATGDGAIILTRLQLAGGKNLPVADVLNSKKALFSPNKHFS